MPGRTLTLLIVSCVAGLGLAAQPAAPLAHGTSISGLWPRQRVAQASGAAPLQLGADSEAWNFRFTCADAAVCAASPKLQRALARYSDIIREQRTLWPRQRAPAATLPLSSLSVVLLGAGGALLEAPPQLGDNESFALSVGRAGATLRASSFGGVHRGLEAFAQLTVKLGGAVVINSTDTRVEGAPAFLYRGLMVDTARHFQPVPALLQLLDGMAASGLNVFHWHLTDAQAFPWNATVAPELVKGAYRPDLTYQRADLEAVVAYAADRAIRVLPEIDMPGHAASVAVGRPDVVVSCAPTDSAPGYDGSCQSSSQLDPSNNATFELLDALFGELAQIFPDKYLHLGGDEVQISCYNSSARVKAWMLTKGWDTACPPKTAAAEGPGEEDETVAGRLFDSNPCANGGVGFKHMVSYFLERVQALARHHGRIPCGWQEVLDHYGGNTSATPTPPPVGLQKDVVIYDWLAPVWGWATPGSIVAAGWRAVSTLGLYLSSNQDNTDWEQYHGAHPLSIITNASAPHGRGWFNITDPAQVARMLGAEGCMWGEHTNGDNLNLRLWPRAAAMAEALWSGLDGANTTEAYPRLLRQRCRMRQRGVPATPLQPGFC